MNLETFFEKFDQFADAPNAVARMRELVLELAVQGSLVDKIQTTNLLKNYFDELIPSGSICMKNLRIGHELLGPIATGEASLCNSPKLGQWHHLGSRFTPMGTNSDKCTANRCPIFP